MNKYGLALHTTSPSLGLALDNFAGDDRHQTWDLGHELGNQLHRKLIEMIAPQTWQDLSFLAVAIGPGSFTGTRLGVVTARTLAQQLDLPLVGISSFATFAWWWVSQNSSNSLESGQILALQSPAQRDRLFVGIYQVTNNRQNPLQTLLSDTVMTPPDWQQKLLGLNSSLQSPAIALEVPQNLGLTATSLLDLAYRYKSQDGHEFPWSAVLPFYGQHPVDN